MRASDTRASVGAWRLTRQLSPRRQVRVAATDADGTLNAYPPHLVRAVDGPAPDAPWAIYLTDERHDYRLLAFDFDAKTDGAATAAHEAATQLAHVAKAAGLDPVICQSGPSGGRHVWCALAEAIPAQLVRPLARLAKALWPQLDLSPINNPATGCVRPPGAPHREGGRSTVLHGDLDALTSPRGTAAQVAELHALLAARVNTAADAITGPTAAVDLDSRRHPWIPGPKRQLSSAARVALLTDATVPQLDAERDGSASAVLWRVLTGAAAAHWQLDDVQALLDAPGLEHVRTRRRPSGPRVARSKDERHAVLHRQWQRAVAHVAAGRRPAGDDPTFPTRAAAIAEHIEHVQARADASPGRWSAGGGPADRRVLDVLCLLALEAVTATVEADIRRVALLAGVGRETARTALLRLSGDGWIIRTKAAEGPNAAHWKIEGEAVIHTDIATARSQVAHAARHTPATATAARNALLLHLRDRTTAATHDAFTPAALGFHAGNVYARCTTTPATLDELSWRTGTDARELHAILHGLVAAGLLEGTRDGWRRADEDRRDQVAEICGTAGLLATRAAAYATERELWAWWQAELAWMHQTKAEREQRPDPTQLALFTAPLPHGPRRKHPRRRGRADFRAARAALVAT